MSKLKFFMVIGICALVVCAIYSPKVAALEGSSGKHEGSAMKEEGSKAAKQMICNEEHLKMMMQKREDRECVVDGVLADEDSREILFEKIAADPAMRKKLMKKCEKMEKMQSEGSMMKHEEMMKKEGSMMEEESEGSMMKHEGGKSK